MDKPKKFLPIDEMYDYHQCAKYIEQKYNIRLRDYYGSFRNLKISEHYDFWHWLFDFTCCENNGQPIYLCECEIKDDAHEATKYISSLFFDEFAEEGGEVGDREFVAWVEW